MSKVKKGFAIVLCCMFFITCYFVQADVQDTSAIYLYDNTNNMDKPKIDMRYTKQSIDNIGSTNFSTYDTVVVDDSILADSLVKKTLKEMMQNKKQIVVMGNDLKKSEIFDVLDLDSSFSFYAGKGGYEKNQQRKKDKDKKDIKYVKEKLKKYIDPFAKEMGEEESYSIIAVRLIDVENQVPHVVLVGGELNENEMNTELDNIVDSCGAYNALYAAGDPTPPSDSVLKGSWAQSKYAKSGTTTMFKWQSSGKLYREKGETDKTYNYYWMWTNDTYSSGDYLYNNGYEMDCVLTDDNIYGGNGAAVIDYTPVDESGTDSINGSINLESGEISVGFQPGGKIDIGTYGGNGETFSRWIASPHFPSLWLPSRFNFKTAHEFRLYDSDSTFSSRSGINVDVERNLFVEGTYYDGHYIQISDN